MKLLIFSFFLLIQSACYCQSLKIESKNEIQENDTVSFVAVVHLENTTKDGIYLNGYIVNLDYEKIKKLEGNKIRVNGKVKIVKGLKNTPKEYDEKGREMNESRPIGG